MFTNFDEDFLKQYKHKQPEWGFNGLGMIVYKRTYARPIYDSSGNLLRTECWWETVKRCIEGAQRIGADYTKHEAEQLFDAIFNLKCSFAGRMLWMLGTPVVERFHGNGLVNCFAGGTRVLTNLGFKEIKDLEGREVVVMTEDGKYVNAQIKNFGKQQLYKIDLVKKGSKMSVFATKDHRWFRRPFRNFKERQIDRRIETTTAELQANDYLVSLYGQSVKNINGPSYFGIVAGLIFGDGSIDNNQCRIRLCGEKNAELLRYFTNCHCLKYNQDSIISHLPRFLKDKPDITLDKNYLYGWLSGYFAADGHIKENGFISIASANKDNLLLVVDICAKLGISTSPIQCQNRVGIGQYLPTPLYTVALNGYHLTEDFFLLSNHRQRYKRHHYQKPMDWKVQNVVKTDRYEDVFCAVVPDTHSFVIDGNILTGNCWGTLITCIEDFCFLFENLMVGGGVGFSVKREHVHELPKVRTGVNISLKNTKDADFIVPDSREGWVELLRKVLTSYFTDGKSFNYSTILIRGYGEIIHGFGGTASGPKILIEGIEKICKILKAREGKKVRSIDVLDICNIIGSVVVAGNIRRSSEIALGDPDDILFLRAKRWDLGNIPNTRVMSNNTICADSYDEIMNEVWDGYQGNGEPYGFYNLKLAQNYGRLGEKIKDNCQLLNPCQPASAIILTQKGLSTIGEIKVGDRIWSKDGWTTILNKRSSGTQKVNKYITTAGYFLGTENHKIISDGEKVEVGKADSIDILCGPFNSAYTVDPQDVMDGLVIGDGMVHKASNNLVLLLIGDNDQDYFKSEISPFIGRYRPGVKEKAYEVQTTIMPGELPKTFERCIPSRYMSEKNKMIGFLRGLYSANGSICGGRITLKTASPIIREQVQLMLSALGISSYYTTNQPSSVKFKNGEYLCKESYDINITTHRQEFAMLIGFIQDYKNEKLQEALKTSSRKTFKTTYDIKDVSYIGEEEVFDLTVNNDSHTYWTGGLNVSNCGEINLSDGEPCCLAELFLPHISSQEEFIKLGKLLYKTQKAVCSLNYIHQKTNDIVHKNYRIGLSVSGICQAGEEKLKWLDGAYKELRAYDAEWSKKKDIPRSIKISTLKPSGSISILAGITPGIHPAYSKFYIRRIRMAATDPLIVMCQEHGYKTEPVLNLDGTQDRRTIIVEFPCKAGEGAIISSEMTAVKQLDLLKKLQTIWSDNSISCTVYYKQEELEAIKKWMQENYEDSVKSVSFLRHQSHNFQQAPYEEITEEKYNELLKGIKPFKKDDANVGNGEFADSLECTKGVCPIK